MSTPSTPAAKTLIFVSSANLQRGPAGARVLADLLRGAGRRVCTTIPPPYACEFAVGSAGILAAADDQPLTRPLAQAASLLIAADRDIRRTLLERYGVPAAKLVALDVPDIYAEKDPALAELLKKKLQPHLQRLLSA